MKVTSGSVIAPTLTKVLLEDGKNVVVFLIGSKNTHIECRNTLNTLKSYELITNQVKIPVNMRVFDNDLAIKDYKNVINELVTTSLVDLSVLLSGSNVGLDNQDIFNFLRYDVSTGNQAKLVALEVKSDAQFREIKEEEFGNIFTVVTLTPKDEDGRFPAYAEYSCNGYVPDAVKSGLDDGALYFITCDNPIYTYTKVLKDKLREYEDLKRSRVTTNSILDDGDNVSNGLVL